MAGGHLRLLVVLVCFVLAAAHSHNDGQHSVAMFSDLREQLSSVVPYVPGLRASSVVEDEVEGASIACLEALNELWNNTDPMNMSSTATSMLDAFGKPGAGLLHGNTHWWGSFDECTAISSAHYCMTQAIVVPKKKLGQKMIPPLPVDLGLCMPKECSASDINALVLNIVDGKVDKSVTPILNIVFSDIMILNSTVTTHCDDPRQVGSGAIVTLCICGLVALLMVLGTAIEVHQESSSDDRSRSSSLTNSVEGEKTRSQTSNPFSRRSAPLENTPLLNGVQSSTQINNGAYHIQVPNKESSMLINLLLCFSVVRNTRHLLSTKVPSGAITSIHGIRVLSIAWVVLGHCYFFSVSIMKSLTQGAVIDRNFTFQAITNAFFSVDTFFCIGGVLVMYLAIKQMDTRFGNLPLGRFYFHRFWRLTPSYMFVILIYSTLFIYLSNGPQWFTLVGGPEMCSKYWWTNLLYINNFYPDMSKSCVGWTWYLANDMQFYVFTPIFIIALHRYGRRGLLVIVGVLAALFGVTAFLTVYYKIHFADMFVLTTHAKAANLSDWGNKLYFKPWSRAAPYLAGLFLGYILRRQEQEFTFSFISKQSKAALVAVGWCLCAIFLSSTLYGLYGTAHSDSLLGMTASTFYSTLSRFTWSVGVAWIVFACHNGYGSIINKILSAPFWTPLSRMTYNVYLIHILVVQWYFFGSTAPFAYTHFSMVIAFLGILVISYMAAFIVTLAVELPFLHMEKVLFQCNSCTTLKP